MIDTRTLPPHDITAEEAVIGSLMLDGKSIQSIPNLQPNDFYHMPLRIIYEACLNLKHLNLAIGEITVGQELDRQRKLEETGGIPYLLKIKNAVPTSLDIESYASVVRNLSISRQLINLGNQCVVIGNQANPDSKKSIDQAYNLISEFKKRTMPFDGLVTPKQAADIIYDLLKKYNSPIETLKWGFRDLDNITTGIYPTEFIIFGSRPSVGKTQIMLDIADNLAMSGKKILFCSAEMSLQHILERRVSSKLELGIRHLRTHGVDESDLHKITSLAGQTAKNNIYYMAHGISASDIYGECLKLKEEIGLDIVFIDYLQFLRDCWETSHENQNVRVGKACKLLKNIATDIGIPVVVASQLNRALEHRSQEERIPTLADLRDSGNIEQDADIVFLLHRDVNNPQTLLVKMAKNRQLGSAEAIEFIWNEKQHRYLDKAIAYEKGGYDEAKLG